MPSYGSGSLFNSSTSTAVVYSGQSDLFSSIGNFGTTAFDSFGDSIRYYLFGNALSTSVVSSFVFYGLIILVVGFVSSYLFFRFRK